MIARFMMIAAAASIAASSAVAEPAKVPSAGTPRGPSRASSVVLASADRIVGTAAPPTQAAPASAKRPRAMRVTTCRCGDSRPQADEQEQQ